MERFIRLYVSSTAIAMQEEKSQIFFLHAFRAKRETVGITAKYFFKYLYFIKFNMRVVIQRVKEATVTIENVVKSHITEGLLILVGIEEGDTEEDRDWLAAKIINLRVFSDDAGLMNRSVMDISGELLVVSQFTLHASTKKGNRPSFLRAAKPHFAVPMYEGFIEKLRNLSNLTVLTGAFGSDMKVHLLNDGPVTIVIDSKNRE
jgi:D-aminoacyl-tRNA deacylase